MAGIALKRPLTVLIIGAGASGLAAAELLGQFPCFNILILEADNRLGGRCKTQPVDTVDGCYDLGASFIHGSESNPVYEMARKHNIDIIKSSTDWNSIRYCTENGQALNKATLGEVTNFYHECIDRSKQFAHAADNSALPKGISTVGAFVRNCLSQRILELDEKEKSTFASIFKCYELLECLNSGCDSLFDLQLKDFGQYQELDGYHWEFKNGYNDFIQLLFNNLNKTNTTIQLNSVVECVDYSSIDQDNCKQLISETSDEHPINVRCTNGKIYPADHVICTIPLGVLKQMAETLFNPTLPKSKLEAIYRLGFGTVNKVYLFYNKPFWGDDPFRTIFIWNDNQYKYPNNETYPLPESEAWLKKVFAISSSDHCNNALVFWMVGSAAEEIENVIDTQVSNSLTKLLNFYIKDPHIELPYKIVKSNWHNNPYSRGSYSYVSSISTGEDFQLIEDPLLSKQRNSPLIMFAGEATHKQFYSTVHGAYLTGRREALRLLQTYGLKS